MQIWVDGKLKETLPRLSGRQKEKKAKKWAKKSSGDLRIFWKKYLYHLSKTGGIA